MEEEGLAWVYEEDEHQEDDERGIECHANAVFVNNKNKTLIVFESYNHQRPKDDLVHNIKPSLLKKFRNHRC